MEKEIIHPKADGIFVDTEGTLIIDDRLNEGLYETMSLLKQIGEKVIILTGSPLKMTKDRLQEIGVDINRFPIEPKAKYRDTIFTGYIIDDCSPSSQRFIIEHPERYLEPYDAESASEFLEYISLTHKQAWEEKLEKIRKHKERQLKAPTKVADHKDGILERLFGKIKQLIK